MPFVGPRGHRRPSISTGRRPVSPASFPLPSQGDAGAVGCHDTRRSETTTMADVSASTERPTIDQVLLEFLDDQQSRLSPRTWRRYADVVELLRACLNSYGYQSLPETDRARWEAAFDTGDEEAFCRLFGPEQIVENYGEFLGYFMVRKVLAGQELLRAAGTVTRRLAQWLTERGYLDPAPAEVAATGAAEASRDLPRAEQLATLLHEHARSTRLDPTTFAPGDYIWTASRSSGCSPARCGSPTGSARSRCRPRPASSPNPAGR